MDVDVFQNRIRIRSPNTVPGHAPGLWLLDRSARRGFQSRHSVMRISIPLDIWEPERGGTERYVQLLAGALQERQHEVTVICLETTRRSREVLRVEVLQGVTGPRWLRELRFARRSVAAHRESGRDVLLAVRHATAADVYHPHGGSFRAGRAAAAQSFPPPWRWARAALAACRPTVHVLRWLDRAVFTSSPELVTVAVSKKVEEDLRHTFPDVDFSFVRLENTVDTRTYQGGDRTMARGAWDSRLGLDVTAPLASFVAHNFRLKGLRHAIGAIARTQHWQLIVAGGGGPRAYRRQARRLGIGHRVHFVGPLSQPRDLYAASDTVLAPTYYDTCALNVLEGLACGTPAVTTRQNGADEVVLRHEAGIIVDRPNDEAGLAMALDQIERSSASFRAGADRAAAAFSWPQHVDTMEALLEQAAERTLRERAAQSR